MAVRLLLATMTLLAVASLAAWGGPALGAPADTLASALVFSSSVDQLARPVGQSSLFPALTNQVWVSFDYRNHEQGRRITYLLRMNDLDRQFGPTTCCAGTDGR